MMGARSFLTSPVARPQRTRSRADCWPARRLSIACAFALLSAGCMIGPDFKRPSAQVADDWMEAGSETIDSGRAQYREWWSSLDDPVLSKLIDLAHEQNLSLLTAGVRVLEARAQLGVAIGEFYPQQQQLSATASYERIPVSAPYAPVSNTFWQLAFGAQVGWEVDLWGKVRRGIESASSAFLASVAAYDDVLVTLAGDVASTYVRIRTIDVQLDIARENVLRQQKALAIARARFAGGVVTRRDVYQAENVLGATEATIPAAHHRATESDERVERAARHAAGAARRPAGGNVRHPGGAREPGRRHSRRPVAAPSRRSPGRTQGSGAVGADRPRQGCALPLVLAHRQHRQAEFRRRPVEPRRRQRRLLRLDPRSSGTSSTTARLPTTCACRMPDCRGCSSSTGTWC
jgi:hypothetical protein